VGSGPLGICWNNDGTKLYQTDFRADEIHEFTLTSAFDITTTSLNATISSQVNIPTGINWNNDGTTFYEINEGDDKIHQLTL